MWHHCLFRRPTCLTVIHPPPGAAHVPVEGLLRSWAEAQSGQEEAGLWIQTDLGAILWGGGHG